jgi:glutathione S-transferase
MLEECGATYELIKTAKPWSEIVRNYNSSGKVPVLLVYASAAESNGEPSLILTESAAINTYLATRFATKNLLLPNRAKYDQMVSFLLTELDAPLWMSRKHCGAKPLFEPIPELDPICRKQVQSVQEQLEFSPYLMGGTFTALDILCCTLLDWSNQIGYRSERSEHLDAYVQLCHERPSYQQAQAISLAAKSVDSKL